MALFGKKRLESELKRKGDDAFKYFFAGQKEWNHVLAIQHYLKACEAFFQVKTIAENLKDSGWQSSAVAFHCLSYYHINECLCKILNDVINEYNDENINLEKKHENFRILKSLCDKIGFKTSPISFDHISKEEIEQLTDRFDENTIASGYNAMKFMNSLLEEERFERLEIRVLLFKHSLFLREKNYNVRKRNFEKGDKARNAIKEVEIELFNKYGEFEGLKTKEGIEIYWKLDKMMCSLETSSKKSMKPEYIKLINEIYEYIKLFEKYEGDVEENYFQMWENLSSLDDLRDYCFRNSEVLGWKNDANKSFKEVLEWLYDLNIRKEAENLVDMRYKVVEPLIRTLKVGDMHIRWEAAEALGNIGDERAIEPLIESLKDEYEVNRHFAANALDKIGWKPGDDIEEIYYLAAKSKWNDLLNLRESSVDLFIKALKDKNMGLRSTAVSSLGYIKDAKAVSPLIEALKDESKYVRENAARALGDIGDKRAVEPLIDALKDECSFVQTLAARALGEIGDKRAVESLIQIVEFKDTYLSEIAIKSIEKIGDTKITGFLIENLKNSNNRNRQMAAGFLGCTKDKRAVEPLIETLKDEDKSVRLHAAVSLVKMEDKRGLGPIFQILEDENDDIRERTAGLLKEAGKLAVEPLIQLLKDDNPKVRKEAAEALEKIEDERVVLPFIEALKDENKDVRFEAACALGNMGDKRAVEPLIGTLNDENREVRAMAVTALGKIRDERAVELLINALRDKHSYVSISAVKALAEIGTTRVVELLVQVLEDENWSIRLRAVRALGNIGDSRVIDPLIKVLGDENWSVRCTAAYALGNIGDERAKKPLTEASKDKNKYVQKTAKWALQKVKKRISDFKKHEPAKGDDKTIEVESQFNKVDAVEPSFCKNCGTKIEKGSYYCHNCGTRLEKIQIVEKDEELPSSTKEEKPLRNFETNEIIECNEEAIKTNPDLAKALFNKGIDHKNSKEYDEALKCFDEAIRADPHCTDAWYTKGVVLGNLGKDDEAQKCYKEAIKADPYLNGD